jgi:hypothetical protein
MTVLALEINFALWIMIGYAAVKVAHLVQNLKSQRASENVAQASAVSQATEAIAHTLKKAKLRNRCVHSPLTEPAVGPTGTVSVGHSPLTESAVGPSDTVSVGLLI